jgi:glycine cleavage system aminomethyltransferase T
MVNSGGVISSMSAKCRNVTKSTSLLDAAAFAKCRIAGPGMAWLDGLLTNAVPKVGRALSCLLTSNRGVRSEFTVYKGAEGYYLVSAGAYRRHDR